MAEQHYDLFFKGDLIDGFFVDFVKGDLQALFKAKPDYIDQLFNGSEHVIRSKVDKPTAVKFQQGFKKAGAKLIVKPHNAALSKPAPVNKRPASVPQQPSATVEKAAPINAPEAPKERSATASTFSTTLGATDGHLEKVEVESHQPNLTAPSSTPNWGVSEPGAVLSETILPPIAEIDTSALSVAEAGADLIISHDWQEPVPKINTDQLSLAPPGETIDTLPDDKEPVKVDVSHLKVE